MEGTLNIPNDNTFSTWMGWFLNYEEYFVLIAPSDEIEDLTRKLMRIGMDNIHGYVTLMQLLDFEKGNFKSYQPLDKAMVEERMSDEEVQIIDIRGVSGIVLGTWIFAIMYPRLKGGVLKKGYFGDITFPSLLKVNDWVAVVPTFSLIILVLYWIENSGF